MSVATFTSCSVTHIKSEESYFVHGACELVDIFVVEPGIDCNFAKAL